jgi:Tol biopolymer transport system component
MARTSGTLLGLALALALIAPLPAGASFLGRNGEIFFSKVSGGRYHNEAMSLIRFGPRRGAPDERWVCSRAPYAAPLRCRYMGEPAFTPDGSKVAVIVDEGALTEPYRWALWLLSPEGQRLESHPIESFYWGPAWAPDASALVASGFLDPDQRPFEDGRTGVFRLGADGSGRTLVAEDASEPDWCADGRIVLVQYGELRVVAPDGRMRRLTRQGGAEPSCSPHSRRVVFTRDGVLWTIPLAGGRARRLTPGFAPAWSPDGKQIAYLRIPQTLTADTYTYVYRIGLRRLRVRRVSESDVEANDGYSDVQVFGPEWRPLPLR